MIAAWQKKAGAPPTGLFTGAQRDQLMRAAALAVARWDEEQKKPEEDKTKTEAAKVAAAAPVAPTASSMGSTVPPTSPSDVSAAQPKSTAYDGTYSGKLLTGGGAGISTIAVLLQVTNGHGAGTLTLPGCSPSQFSAAVQPAGKVSGEGNFNCWAGHSSSVQFTGPFKISGAHEGKSLRLSFFSDRGARIDTVLTPGAAASPSLLSPDGLWRGTYSCTAAIGSNPSMTPPFTINFDVLLANGTGYWKASDASPANGNTLQINVSVDSSGVKLTRFASGVIGTQLAAPNIMAGQYDGNAIRGNGRESGPGVRECVLAMKRA